jgi:hypothetical protein
VCRAFPEPRIDRSPTSARALAAAAKGGTAPTGKWGSYAAKTGTAGAGKGSVQALQGSNVRGSPPAGDGAGAFSPSKSSGGRSSGERCACVSANPHARARVDRAVAPLTSDRRMMRGGRGKGEGGSVEVARRPEREPESWGQGSGGRRRD